TPSDIVPVRLSQGELDELAGQQRIADVLPLTPIQRGLLFHASAASGEDHVYAVQLDLHLTGAVEPRRLRHALDTVVRRHPNLAARFCAQFDEPVQVIPAEPVAVWRYVELDGGLDESGVEAEVGRVCAAERAAVCDLGCPPAFRAVLIGVGGDRYRFVLTNHHIVVDGWSMPIVLREIFAGYQGQRLPAAAPYRNYVRWLADRDLDAAR
ncbi:condensation domain-containing protein, partial [Mycobacterium asiaticum]|uniref:condensation domain-containing protein n=1 Tax=Mycobacterium asiaticum TaxID=1790 RepID=UPI000A8FDBB8